MATAAATAVPTTLFLNNSVLPDFRHNFERLMFQLAEISLDMWAFYVAPVNEVTRFDAAILLSRDKCHSMQI